MNSHGILGHAGRMTMPPAGPPRRGHHRLQHHQPHYHGFCSSCCHPAAKCCCHRECRKESKELLVNALEAREEEGLKLSPDERRVVTTMKSLLMAEPSPAAAGGGGKEAGKVVREGGEELIRLTRTPGIVVTTDINVGQAVIGGGCCVHLSVEYMPVPGAGNAVSGKSDQMSVVHVEVLDSESTLLGWAKIVDGGYHIKECIITTNPGAILTVGAVNAIARVRWCEIFSC